MAARNVLNHYTVKPKPTLAPEAKETAFMPSPIRDQVFISYSHQDRLWLDRLEMILKPLMRAGRLATWSDKHVQLGARWREEIDNALARAKVAVLLVSPDFLASNFIAMHELPPLLEAARQEGIRILWIYLRQCLYEATPIGDYQAAHDVARPLSVLSRHEWESVLLQVARAIQSAFHEIDVEKRLLEPSWPSLLVQGIVTHLGKTQDGVLIQSVTPVWTQIAKRLSKEPHLAYEIEPRTWEELVAAAFAEAKYDEVVLTPRSGDFGRDVIASKNGVGSVRIVGSVKAFKPGHLVRHDDVRALLGVLSGDSKASKGIITTTSDFAPTVTVDPFIKPFIPYRLELLNGQDLLKWFDSILDF